MARASPISDAHGHHPRCAKSEQGLPGQGRARLKKRVKQRKEKELRVGTLNMRTLRGKARELADLMDRRKVDILCLQETTWKGNKSKEVARGHKLIYSGETGRNGVAVVLSNYIWDTLVQVSRRSKRMMSQTESGQHKPDNHQRLCPTSAMGRHKERPVLDRSR